MIVGEDRDSAQGRDFLYITGRQKMTDKSRINTTAITEAAKLYSDNKEKYAAVAQKMAEARKYSQLYTGELLERLTAHIDECAEKEKPLTISGMILASGVSVRDWYRMRHGEYDYKFYEYTDMNDVNAMEHTYIAGVECAITADGRKVALVPYSHILEKAYLVVEQQTEERLYQKGRVGDIFALKAKHAWNEEASPSTVNNTLVIATEEQARRAIDLLK